METFDEDKLSDKAPIFKIAFRMLKHAMRDILYGNCDEDEVAEMIARISPSRNGYYKDEDFFNTDEAMEYLILGKNRVKFHHLLKEYNITSKKISNMNVGYLKKEIKLLKIKMQEEAEQITKVGRTNKVKYLGKVE